MKRRRKYRPRLEFLHLESQLDPDFETKAWRRLIDQVVHGKEPEDLTSYVPQFRLRERICGLHARRTRWNARRRLRRWEALARQMRLEYLGYVAAGLLKLGEAGKDDFRADLLGGALCVDTRLTKKFLRELEVIHEMIHPSFPPPVIGQRWAVDEDASLPAYQEQADFQASLRPVPVPPPAPTLVFLEEEPSSPNADHAEATETTAAARAAS